MSSNDATTILAKALAAGRIAIGAGLWLAPGTSMRALGFPNAEADALAIARIAGARDLVMGIWQLRAVGRPDELRRASAAAAACDAGDAVAFVLLIRDGHAAPGLKGIGAAGPAAALNAWLASR